MGGEAESGSGTGNLHACLVSFAGEADVIVIKKGVLRLERRLSISEYTLLFLEDPSSVPT